MGDNAFTVKIDCEIVDKYNIKRNAISLAFYIYVDPSGIEPLASSMPWKRSTK